MILHLLEEKSAEGVQFFIMVRVCIVLVCWLFMVISVLIDFWSGTSTAKALGEKIQSKGFRRTIAKMCDYIKVMLFALMFDALGSLLSFYVAPFATMLCTVAIMVIEASSVIENSRRKKANAAHVPEMIRKIVQAATTKQANSILEQISKITEHKTIET